jgi:hypothetical protein
MDNVQKVNNCINQNLFNSFEDKTNGKNDGRMHLPIMLSVEVLA